MSLPSLNRARSLVAAAGLIALVPLLSSCDKPQATITILSNSRSTIVPAQPSCTMLDAGGCAPVAGRQKTVKATGGSQILVDVPRALADAGWIVTAYTTDGKTNTPLTSPSGVSTGPVNGEHTVRLNVPAATTGSYYLQITALKPSNQLTNWLCLVQLSR